MSNPTNGQVDAPALWAEYAVTRSDEARNRLVEHYYPLARRIGNGIAGRLPRSIDSRDLVSNGVIGLIQAITNFDPNRGLRFETYAGSRVRGAILDYLREIDFVPRLVRQQAARYHEAHQALLSTLGREPSLEELAKRLKVSAEKAEELRRESSIVYVYNFTPENDYDAGDQGGQERGMNVLLDTKTPPPAQQSEVASEISYILSLLTPEERVVIILYYLEENMTMREIADEAGISESRVCQVHGAAIRRLRKRMGME
jgi:RNA polymerase sigma factor for flagellar operon FliA